MPLVNDDDEPSLNAARNVIVIIGLRRLLSKLVEQSMRGECLTTEDLKGFRDDAIRFVQGTTYSRATPEENANLMHHAVTHIEMWVQELVDQSAPAPTE